MWAGWVGSVRAHGTNRARVDWRAVGAAGAAAAAAAAEDGPAAQGTPAGGGGDGGDPAGRGAGGGRARRVRALADGGGPLLRLAPPGRLGGRPAAGADPGGCAGDAGLAAAGSVSRAGR